MCIVVTQNNTRTNQSWILGMLWIKFMEYVYIISWFHECSHETSISLPRLTLNCSGLIFGHYILHWFGKNANITLYLRWRKIIFQHVQYSTGITSSAPFWYLKILQFDVFWRNKKDLISSFIICREPAYHTIHFSTELNNPVVSWPLVAVT